MDLLVVFAVFEHLDGEDAIELPVRDLEIVHVAPKNTKMTRWRQEGIKGEVSYLRTVTFG